jgi:hypothetical protein
MRAVDSGLQKNYGPAKRIIDMVNALRGVRENMVLEVTPGER